MIISALAAAAKTDEFLILRDVPYTTIVLMGGCFMLGSIFTIMLLLVIDWVKAADEGRLE